MTEEDNSRQTIEEALFELSTEARDLYLDKTVPVLSSRPSPLTFYREFVSSNKPVIIRNSLKHWKALQKWDAQYFRKVGVGDVEVTVAVTPNGLADAVAEDKFVMPEERRMTFSEFLDILEEPEKHNGIFYIQKQNSNLTEEFAHIINDVEREIPWGTEAFGESPDAVNFWMGDGRAVTSMHRDHYENLYCVVRGWKTFILIPPTDIPYIPYDDYQPAVFKETDDGKFDIVVTENSEKVPWISIDPLNPDLVRYPDYAKARPIEVTVKEGEILYLPSLWFHHVRQSHGCIAESLLSLAWVVISNVATLLVRYMMAVRHLNPVKLIRDKQKRIYYTDAHGVVPVYPRWSERLVNLVISDNRRYRNILQWVQRNLPNHSITNFTSSWHDGIVLCSLLEALQPGVCPGSGHLKHHNRVNNCRLGIRLATQSLGLPQDMILPEEMAIADKTTELKILKYVSMIKWAAENKAFTNEMKNEMTCAKKMTSCVAKGSGLEAGIIGKKMRFTLLVTDVVGMFHLNIDIKGPKNEIYNETIISLRQSSDLHQDNSSTALIKDRNPNPSIDERVMEFHRRWIWQQLRTVEEYKTF
ncbi:hypothetical protein FSP39_013400 [Pinctada imbricata]|uniref:Bifunctional peptidase and (3S)-lysyl hydroxylase JMJD7 n=1 Tax=Pinctada imbricata TaxID=66713 RepID=A0AA89BYM7_PINIB|nr:hypothetical protein FSP39_013400 [Pinctada imbricata]